MSRTKVAILLLSICLAIVISSLIGYPVSQNEIPAWNITLPSKGEIENLFQDTEINPIFQTEINHSVIGWSVTFKKNNLTGTAAIHTHEDMDKLHARLPVIANTTIPLWENHDCDNVMVDPGTGTVSARIGNATVIGNMENPAIQIYGPYVERYAGMISMDEMWDWADYKPITESMATQRRALFVESVILPDTWAYRLRVSGNITSLNKSQLARFEQIAQENGVTELRFDQANNFTGNVLSAGVIDASQIRSLVGNNTTINPVLQDEFIHKIIAWRIEFNGTGYNTLTISNTTQLDLPLANIAKAQSTRIVETLKEQGCSCVNIDLPTGQIAAKIGNSTAIGKLGTSVFDLYGNEKLIEDLNAFGNNEYNYHNWQVITPQIELQRRKEIGARVGFIYRMHTILDLNSLNLGTIRDLNRVLEDKYQVLLF